MVKILRYLNMNRTADIYRSLSFNLPNTMKYIVFLSHILKDPPVMGEYKPLEAIFQKYIILSTNIQQDSVVS